MGKKIIVFMLLVITTLTLSAQSLKAYVLESEPLGFIENGIPKGEHYDYLLAIAERSGVAIDIEIVPKSKLFAAIQSGDIDLAIFFRASKWDSSVEYASKIRDINVIALNRADQPLIAYNDLHNSARVGIIANTSVSSEFDNDTQIVKYSVSNYETMLKLLTSKRIDSAVGNAIVLSYLMKKYNYTSTIQPQGLSLGTSTQWLQFSKKSQNLALMPKIQQAVKELQAEGKFDDILSSYAGSGWVELNN